MAYEHFNLRSPWTRFDGGLNTFDPAQYIDSNQSPDMLNVQPLGKNAYGPRFGTAPLGGFSEDNNPVFSLFNFKTTSDEILIRSQDTFLEYISNSQATWTALPDLRATGLLSFISNPADGDQITIGSDTYTFLITPVGATDIQIGVDAAETLLNAVPVLNGNTDATFEAQGSATILIIATTAGTAGNTVATTSATSAVTFSASTLLGGADNSSWTQNLRWGFDSALVESGGSIKNVMYGCNGTDNFMSWDGASDARAYPFNPKGTIFKFWGRLLLVAGVSASPATIYISRISVPADFQVLTTFTPGDPDFINLGDGGDIITSIKVGPLPSTSEKVPYILKQSTRAYYLTVDLTTGIYTPNELVSDTGAINNRSTQNLDNDIFYVDPGNNIAKLGRVENILGEVRTNPAAIIISPTTQFYDFSDACAVFWAKRRIYIISVKEFNSDLNNIELVYFQDFDSWYRWKGLDANEYAIWHNELVWASSVSKNVYKYDETIFEEQNDPDIEGGAILSYRRSPATENVSIEGVPLHDRFKQARFAMWRGYISPNAKNVEVSIMYNEDPNNVIKATFDAGDGCIMFGTSDPNVYGRVIFGRDIVYGGENGLSPLRYTLREFFVILSLDGYSYLRASTNFKVQGVGMPYVIFFETLWSGAEPEEKLLDCTKIS